MDIYQFLNEHGIDFIRHDHPPVYTVYDVNRLIPSLPGAKTKNLFFRDKKGKRHFLVMVPDYKKVNMKKLHIILESSRISFGSPERLKKYLGIEPGSVSLLAVVNDKEKEVEIFIDNELWESEAFQFHPLVNTSTLTVSKENIMKFLNATGHTLNAVDIPGK